MRSCLLLFSVRFFHQETAFRQSIPDGFQFFLGIRRYGKSMDPLGQGGDQRNDELADNLQILVLITQVHLEQ